MPVILKCDICDKIKILDIKYIGRNFFEYRTYGVTLWENENNRQYCPVCKKKKAPCSAVKQNTGQS